ncbi:hypothetical protein NHQ30_011057 [Ciborinia camelliae]|nr:hypothetical protein NHQ30_011057 [Ciborinia camelliae]
MAASIVKTVELAASIPTLKPVALTRYKFTSSQGTDSGFSWRRLFKSRGSTNRSHTEDEHKPSEQPHIRLSNKNSCGVYTAMLRCEDDHFVEGVTPKNEMELKGIHKTTEFTIGYADKSLMSEQPQVKPQREFEMV